MALGLIGWNPWPLKHRCGEIRAAGIEFKVTYSRRWSQIAAPTLLPYKHSNIQTALFSDSIEYRSTNRSKIRLDITLPLAVAGANKLPKTISDFWTKIQSDRSELFLVSVLALSYLKISFCRLCQRKLSANENIFFLKKKKAAANEKKQLGKPKIKMLGKEKQRLNEAERKNEQSS